MGSKGRILLVVLALALGAAPSAAAAKLRLLHDSFSTAYRSPGGAVPAGTAVTLRLRATGAPARAVSLRVTQGRAVRAYRMRRRGGVWSATIATPRTPALLGYAFRIRLANRVVWYGDDFGDVNDDVHQGGTGIVGEGGAQPYQLTVYDAAFQTPQWLRETVLYEIFPDRFRNGNPSNDPCRAGGTTGCPLFYGSAQARLHATWNEPVEDPSRSGVFNRDFFGGDLEGIRQGLRYLQSLGVGAVWMTPIFQARSNHRYDTDDYFQVDAGLGGDAAFAALVRDASARDIRLILDGVFNHTSSDSRYFDRYHRYPSDGACESATSPWRDWYSFSNAAIPCSEYRAFANLDTLPQLNHANPAVRAFVESVIRHWNERGAAGWRLDAADSVTNETFWDDFRRRAKAAAPDAPLIGEVWPDASAYLLGTRFDGIMDYRFRRAALGFVRQTDYSDSSGPVPARRPSELDRALHAIREDYPPQALASSFELIDSHDTVRALYVVKEPNDSLEVAKQRQRLAAFLQFTYVGVPMVYYGDEAGIDAPGPDPFDRPPFPWLDESGEVDLYGPPDETMLAYYGRLARLRRDLPALRGGGFQTLVTDDRRAVYAFARSGGAAKPVLVALNKSGGRVQARVPVRRLYPDGTTLVDELSARRYAVAGSAVTVELPPRGGAVLVG